MTEEEAKKKWCPMVRVSNRGDGADNRAADRGKVYGTDIPWENCIASDCMMWRWESESYERSRIAVHQSVIAQWESRGYEKGGPAPDKGTDWYWMEPIPPNHVLGKGYCGLGGVTWTYV